MKETKFKQTEVGLIPNDWEVKKIGELYKVHNGLSKGKQFFGHGYPFLSFSVVFNNVFIPNKLENLVDSSKEERASYSINKGDVFITRTSETVDELGMSCVALKDYPNATYNGFCKRLRPNDVEFVNLGYLGFYLRSDFIREWFLKFSTVTTRASLKNDELLSLPLVLPPTIEEQQRIANALSDVDTLINNLEKLIAKKKNIKQGAMQQLLTGRKRLPGFGLDNGHTDWFTPNGVHEKSIKTAKVVRPESIRVKDKEQCAGFKMTELGLIPTDWEVKTISQVGKIIGGGTPSTFNSAYWNGSVQWFTPAELSKAGKYVSKSERTITKQGVENCSAKILPAGTILLTTRASIGTSAILKAPACTNQGFQSLVVNSENSNEFLYYLLSTKVDEMMSLASGSTFLEISPKKLGGIQLQIPSSRAEQTAIANVLSDMDTEIATLETKLAKYRKLKTGMMQQLLTGKIRLV